MAGEVEAIEKLQKAILDVNERLFKVDGTLAGIQVSLNVLKAYVSIQMSPDAPLESLKQLALLERRLRAWLTQMSRRKNKSLKRPLSFVTGFVAVGVRRIPKLPCRGSSILAS